MIFITVMFILRSQKREWSNEFLQLPMNKENVAGVMNHKTSNVSSMGVSQNDLHQEWASEYLQDIPIMEGKRVYVQKITNMRCILVLIIHGQLLILLFLDSRKSKSAYFTNMGVRLR